MYRAIPRKYVRGPAAMDPSLLLKQSMETDRKAIQSVCDYVEGITLELNEPHHSQKRTRETCSDDNEFDSWVSWDGLFSLPQSNNQHGINDGVVSNQTDVITAQASQPINISSSYHLKRNYSSLSETDRAQKKKRNDQAYRERCRRQKENMQVNLDKLRGENDSLKKENESLKKDNALMNGTLGDQAKEIDQLRNDLVQLKREHEKQNVLVQTLSGFLSDPVRLENEKLKDENASLKKNINLNNLALLAEENAKLRTENKVLRVQNDALCGKIISDNDRKRDEK